jgi:predicted DCC family thiol-disulfide oxidoreductase YuxK
MAQLTLFYDGGCPLCLAEMRHLYQLDQEQCIEFVDINSQEFASQHPTIDRDEANRILHGQLPSGEIILGLDVTHRAWTLVGKGWWIAPLRWPLFKPVADWAYLLFARHRNLISKWVTGQPRCQSCSLDRSE